MPVQPLRRRKGGKEFDCLLRGTCRGCSLSAPRVGIVSGRWIAFEQFPVLSSTDSSLLRVSCCALEDKEIGHSRWDAFGRVAPDGKCEMHFECNVRVKVVVVLSFVSEFQDSGIGRTEVECF